MIFDWSATQATHHKSVPQAKLFHDSRPGKIGKSQLNTTFLCVCQECVKLWPQSWYFLKQLLKINWYSIDDVTLTHAHCECVKLTLIAFHWSLIAISVQLLTLFVRISFDSKWSHRVRPTFASLRCQSAPDSEVTIHHRERAKQLFRQYNDSEKNVTLK